MIELHDYQIQACGAVDEGFRTCFSQLLVLATGLGKTVCAAAIADHEVSRGGRVLYIAHRTELLSQPTKTFGHWGLACGLEKAGAKVDVADLPQVTFASVQTLKGARLERFPPNAFSLVIIDEAHRTEAKTYQAIIKHFCGGDSCAKLLGLTATPFRLDGKPLGETYDRIAFEMGIGEGVAKGWLCPLEGVNVAVESMNLDGISKHAGDFSPSELDERMTLEPVVHGIAKPASELIGKRPTIAFTVSVRQAKLLADVLGTYGVKAQAVTGEDSEDVRKDAIAAYKAGELQVLVNVGVFVEGFDAPSTSCILLAAPTASVGKLRQQIGRGTRLSPETGKTDCLIVSFVPGMVKSKTFQTPKDVLQGCAVSQRPNVGETYEDRAREEEAIRDALLAMTGQKSQLLIDSMGVEYAVTMMPIAEFIGSTKLRGAGDPPSARQLELLESKGLSKKEIEAIATKKQASAIIDGILRRREEGLCSYKQAKILRSKGLNPNVSMELANEAMAALQQDWRVTPEWLKNDRRFAITVDNGTPNRNAALRGRNEAPRTNQNRVAPTRPAVNDGWW